ncbi:HAD family hydrolase [Brevibacterium sp. UCMA 11754]|uniref:HAD family hydrolase n=1 Tax=Brevibacterium sp. UCMA 11754 TaxID=2749198 RepID=UPI001F410D9C|nr:HAD family phosphatase [Brevibacterium sp. UCMA 11754]MCF2572446.1 HAD family phosphatase [Brevibacterium sp. UCMA 11754]
MTHPTDLHPTTVVFDLGNVLIGWDQTGPLADRMTRYEWNDFAAEADFGMLNTLADRGVPITEVIARAAESDPSHGEIIAAYYDRFDLSLTGPIQGMAEVVAELRASDVRLLGLSNWSAETFHHAPKVAPAINELEDIVVSGREKLIKPDPEIFHVLSRRFDLVPERTVFVDDLPANIDAAEQLGFIGLLFTDARQLRDDLIGLGLLSSPAAAES